MRGFIVLVGLLHAAFMVCEMYPWSNPILLRTVTKTLPAMPGEQSSDDREESTGPKFTPRQQSIVATIVHNAGIYNAVLAAGLFWTAYRGRSADEFAIVLFVGAAVAGIFGTATIRSPVTVIQAILGIIGAIWVRKSTSASAHDR